MIHDGILTPHWIIIISVLYTLQLVKVMVEEFVLVDILKGVFCLEYFSLSEKGDKVKIGVIYGVLEEYEGLPTCSELFSPIYLAHECNLLAYKSLILLLKIVNFVCTCHSHLLLRTITTSLLLHVVIIVSL